MGIESLAAVYPWMTSSYARNIIAIGTQRFTPRDGFTGIPENYRLPVKQYIAGNYSVNTIESALVMTWINQTEFEEIMSYVV